MRRHAALAVLLAAAAHSQEAPDAGLRRELIAAFDAAAPADGPATTLVVSKDGRVLVDEARGLADMELGVRAVPDSVFPIGSTTKSFTAALVLRLAREGKLSLDDPLERHVSGFPRGSSLTLRRLLAHQSGVRDYSDLPGTMRRACAPAEGGEVLATVRDLRPLFEPGAAWSYSNSNYLLLGQVIEKVTGGPYEEALARRLLEPLELRRTSAPDDATLVPGRVKLHVRSDDGGWARAVPMSRSWTGAAGEILSTARDLALWGGAWLDGRAVEEEDRAEAWREQPLQDGSPSGYGLGWFVARHGELTVVEHGGNVPGASSALVVVPEARVVVALLHAAEPSPLDAGALARRLALRAAGAPDEVPPKEFDLTPAQASALTGTYAFPEGPRTVFLRGGELRLRWDEDTDAALIAVSPRLLRSESGSSRLEFTLSGSGAASAVTLSGWSHGRQTAPRMDVPAPERLAGAYRSAEGLEVRVEARDGDGWITLVGMTEALRMRPVLGGSFRIGGGAQEAAVYFDLPAEGPARNVTVQQGPRVVTAPRVP